MMRYPGLFAVAAGLVVASCSPQGDAPGANSAEMATPANDIATPELKPVDGLPDDGRSATGIVTKKSAYSVAETMDRLKAAVAKKGLTVFATVDHAENAAGADLEMPPAKVLVFGNPKLGTPLMRAAPTVSLDLPQRMSVYRDAAGDVRLSYNDPHWLVTRHGITGQDAAITKISSVLSSLSDTATGA